jgi:NADH:ubiquinone oxidoreductase subunit E
MLVDIDIESRIQPIVADVLAGYPGARREHLIAILQELQHQCGYLSPGVMIEVGRRLHLPASKVFGVATFYNQFRFEPRGRVHCQVCRGTACHIKGSGAVLDALRHTLQVEPGHTSGDGRFSLETVACTGACGLAPVVVINDTFHAGMTPDAARRLMRRYARQTESAEATGCASHADGTADDMGEES